MSKSIKGGLRSAVSGSDSFAESFRPVLVLVRPLLAFSGVVNIMTLAVSLYTMQIYDRVLSSQSKDTLFYLTLAVLMATALSALMDAIRQQTAARAASWFASRLGPQLLTRALDPGPGSTEGGQEPLRELSRLKSFLASPTLFNLFDILWVPLYVVVVFALHPVFGAICAFGAGALLFLTWYVEMATRNDINANQQLATANQRFVESVIRNNEAITAMGMAQNVVACWATGFTTEAQASDKTQAFTSRIIALTKFVRMTIQIALLGVGALLVLDLQITGGALIAGSILSARLLAPIEASMTYWKQFVLARSGFVRLSKYCRQPPTRLGDMELPAPSGTLQVESLTFVPPGAPAAVLRGVSFGIAQGTMLAVVGPSASGKTTLARLLVGVSRPSAGHVRLDGADTFDWKRSDFGRYVGYLPQDVELLPGSVRNNIARFDPNASDADVVAAAKLSDCHELILQLSGGYDCMLTDGGHQLSGGQRQRIGLARALFGMPLLVVLDEPNASLDARGDAALAATLARLKEARITAVVVSHRNNMLQLADKLLVLSEGRVTNFGDRDQVIDQLTGERKASGPTASYPRARMVRPSAPRAVNGGHPE